jgi:two-component system chemotaxis response regulator CheB
MARWRPPPRNGEPVRPGGERDAVVAIAASAGGIHALSAVLSELPVDLPAPVVVLLHLDPHHDSALPAILDRRTSLAVAEAREGVIVREAHVYVAPPDHHLLVERGGVLSLTKGELVHFVRPSADLLFESVAAAYGSGAVAVVLSGTGVDGALGVTAIKDRGGVVIVQDMEAEFAGMPGAAIATGAADVVAPLRDISRHIVAACELVRR